MATALIAPTETPQVGIRTVMVCFSSSDDCTALVAMAGKLALPGNASIHICYRNIPNQIAFSGPGLSSERTRFPAASPAHAAKKLRAMGLNVELNSSPIQQADLVVMTTSFNSTLTFGSQDLASRAARLLRKPILFFRGDPPSQDPSRNCGGGAVVAVSLSERSLQLVQKAAHYAGTLKSPLNLIHVVDILHDFSRPDNLMSLMGACEILGKSVDHPGLQIHSRLSYGSVAEVFTRAELLKEAPFVALGVDLTAGQTDAMESDALRETIVRNAPCPVLLIPTHRSHPTA